MKDRFSDIPGKRPAADTLWDGAHKIPWNDPAFSRRILREHLSQDHHLASRKAQVIRDQVAWIRRAFLSGGPRSILDLGCGPGLYRLRSRPRREPLPGPGLQPRVHRVRPVSLGPRRAVRIPPRQRRGRGFRRAVRPGHDALRRDQRLFPGPLPEPPVQGVRVAVAGRDPACRGLAPGLRAQDRAGAEDLDPRGRGRPVLGRALSLPDRELLVRGAGGEPAMLPRGHGWRRGRAPVHHQGVDARGAGGAAGRGRVRRGRLPRRLARAGQGHDGPVRSAAGLGPRC